MQLPPEQVKQLADDYIKEALSIVEEARIIEEAESRIETGESMLKLAVVLSALTASVVVIKNSPESLLDDKALEGKDQSPTFAEG